MRRGSNAVIEIVASDLKEELVKKVFISMNQLGVNMYKEASLNDGKARIELTEEETRKFAAGPVFLQVVAHMLDGSVVQSDYIRYKISDTLTEGVIKIVESGNGFDIRD